MHVLVKKKKKNICNTSFITRNELKHPKCQKW